MANKAAKKKMRTLATGNSGFAGCFFIANAPRLRPGGGFVRPGFTLVEIIVVVVIIAVLATMIVPSLSAGSSSSKLRGSARQLLVAAQYARDYAATRRRKCRLTIDLDQQQYALTFQSAPQHNPSEFVPLPLATGLGRTQRLSQGVRFVKVWVEPRKGHDQPDQPPKQLNYITFEPNGQADAAVLEITNGRQTYSVLIVPHTGYAKLIEGTTRALPNDRLDLDI